MIILKQNEYAKLKTPKFIKKFLANREAKKKAKQEAENDLRKLKEGYKNQAPISAPVQQQVPTQKPKKQYSNSRKKKRNFHRELRNQQQKNSGGSVMQVQTQTPTHQKGMTRFQKESLARKDQPKTQTPGKLTVLGSTGGSINPEELGNSVLPKNGGLQGGGSVTKFKSLPKSEKVVEQVHTPGIKENLAKNRESAQRMKQIQTGQRQSAFPKGTKTGGTIQFNKTDVPSGSIMSTKPSGGIKEQQRLRQESKARMDANPQNYQGLQYNTQAGGTSYVPKQQGGSVMQTKPQTIEFTPSTTTAAPTQTRVTTQTQTPSTNTVTTTTKPQTSNSAMSSPLKLGEGYNTGEFRMKGVGSPITPIKTKQQTSVTQTQTPSTNTVTTTPVQNSGENTEPNLTKWQRAKNWWERRTGREKAGIIGGSVLAPFAGYNIGANMSNNDK